MKIFRKLSKRKIIILFLALLIVFTFSTAAISMTNSRSDKFKGIRIYLSPSNQYSNIYATGDTSEMEQCEKIADAAAKELENCGFTVMVGQSGADIYDRCNESDAFNADMHIPIHTNALNGEYTGGTHIYVYDINNKYAAECLLDTVGAISPGEDDRIDYMPDLYEVYIPQATTVYIECEFHDTLTGAEWIENNTDAIARAIADGVTNYYSNLE